jgi:hypothetical protein
MTYNPPPHYNLGGPNDPQQPQSVPPSYSPQPPADPGYSQQSPAPAPPGPPTQAIPGQPMYATQPLLQPPPPMGPRKSSMVPLLAMGMVVGLAGAAVTLALWLSASSDLEDAEALAADRNDQIAQLEEDLEAAQAEAVTLETQVSDLEGQLTDFDSMQACIDALKAYQLTAPESEEEAAALIVVQTDCAGWVY